VLARRFAVVKPPNARLRSLLPSAFSITAVPLAIEFATIAGWTASLADLRQPRGALFLGTRDGLETLAVHVKSLRAETRFGHFDADAIRVRATFVRAHVLDKAVGSDLSAARSAAISTVISPEC
jgi:hypothetical protein